MNPSDDKSIAASLDYLADMLASFNFEIENVSRIKSTMGNGKEVTDLIIISRKKDY